MRLLDDQVPLSPEDAADSPPTKRLKRASAARLVYCASKDGTQSGWLGSTQWRTRCCASACPADLQNDLCASGAETMMASLSKRCCVSFIQLNSVAQNMMFGWLTHGPQHM